LQEFFNVPVVKEYWVDLSFLLERVVLLFTLTTIVGILMKIGISCFQGLLIGLGAPRETTVTVYMDLYYA
jgi:hypothetical protein